MSIEQIRKYIGADGLFYNTIEDIRTAVQYGNRNIKKFSEGCFTGKYPTPEVNAKLLKALGQGRNESREAWDAEQMSEDNSGDQKMMALV
ncbi:MAG: Amidophosphoribosyltransferase [Candidatus Peregrinibacteria bacterium Greene0416_62]|nr:MAG: Amidophosphoribosyltransferase [Candidatus Peregrinibacteria bacterium Greene0416_62]